jgi:quercetin dioxygenase-like cupin family protein
VPAPVPRRVKTRTPAEWSRLAPGVRVRQVVHGGGTVLRLYRLDPGTDFQVHVHDHAELGMVLAGSGLLLVDGAERRLEAGDAFFLPAHLPHAFRADDQGEPALFLNVEATDGSAAPGANVDDLARLARAAGWPVAAVSSERTDPA